MGLLGGGRPDVDVGDEAPDFALPDADGEQVRLSDLLAEGPVVLYFYPKDASPGCTREACAFRDRYGDLTEAGATVVGVSLDPPSSHRRFADDHGLPFPLLSDEEGAVRDLYGIPDTLGVIPGRVTYVIDRDAGVRAVHVSQLRPASHVQEALEALADLEG